MQGLFVGVSEISFLIPPSAYPARCGLLLTTLLVRSSHSLRRKQMYLKKTTKKVLVNMFNSALSSTPSASSGLTALAVWILTCIVFVKFALTFYVVILVNAKRLSKRTHPLDEEKSNNPIDLDPLFFGIHFVAFGLFVMTHFFVYLL